MSRQVRSVVRLRPPRREPDVTEAAEAAAVRWCEEGGTVTVQSDSAGCGGSAAELNFDAVVGPNSACGTSQAAFYDVFVQPALGDALVNGTNATVLAYGQTGSGKTHTMASGSFNPSSIPNQYPLPGGDGSPASSSTNSPKLHDTEEPVVVVSEVDGVVPRALADVFAMARTRGSDKVTIRVSYYELYNETFRDLLWAAGSSSSSTKNTAAEPKLRLRLRRGSDGDPEFFVENLLGLSCATLEEALNWYRLGSIRRAVRGHAMNARSSRSHTIFAVTVSWHDNGADVDREATVTLVDLAGSEKISSVAPGGRPMATPAAAAAAGGRPRSSGRGGGGYEALLGETARINSSLLALGKVIDALAKASSAPKAGSGATGAAPHIPYRESKLTSVLRSAISHRSATIVIACADPSYPDETLRTLNFASRARKITAQATLRPGMGGGDARSRLVADLRLRIAELEGKLAAMAAELDEARMSKNTTVAAAAAASLPAPPDAATAAPVAATADADLAGQTPTRRAEDAAASMAEVEAAVRQAMAEADGVIRPLSTKLVASCERLQAVVAANTGLRSALDAAMLRCREQEGERLGLEEENAGLRDRIQLLEEALLAPTATEQWLLSSGHEGSSLPHDHRKAPRSAPSAALRPRPPPGPVVATGAPSASAAGLAATYGGGHRRRSGLNQPSPRPARKQPATARTAQPATLDSEASTPSKHGGTSTKRGTPRSARHRRPSTADPVIAGHSSARGPQQQRSGQPRPAATVSTTSQPSTPRRSKPAPASLSSGATLASLLGSAPGPAQATPTHHM